MSIVREHLEKWAGDAYLFDHEYFQSDLGHFLFNHCYYGYISPNTDEQFEYRQTHYFTTTELRSLIASYDPMPDKNNARLVSYYASSKDRRNDRRTSGKPGKVFKKILPILNNVHVDRMVDIYKETYAFTKDMYVVKTGKTPEDFRRAYSHEQAPNANLNTTAYRKSLACSCMRYSFDYLDHHPAEAYASGDFTIVWAETSDGKIAARCVVMTLEDDDSATPVAGPIYAVNEVACDVIEQYITGEMGGRMWDGGSGDWEGARMKRIPYKAGNGLIGPYLDMLPQKLEDDGEYLVISYHGDIYATEVEGVLDGTVIHTCSCCGGTIDEDDDICTSCEGEVLCHSCYSDHYILCGYDGEEYERDGGEEYVRIRPYWYNGWFTDEWSSTNVQLHANYCVDVSAYVQASHTIELANGDCVTVDAVDNGEYACCDGTGKYYPAHEMTTLDDMLVHESVIDSERHHFNEALGAWETRNAA